MARPRLHANGSERNASWRARHNLSKVTVEVPSEFANVIRTFARLLRSQPDHLTAIIGLYDICFSDIAKKQLAIRFLLRVHWNPLDYTWIDGIADHIARNTSKRS